MNSAAQTRVLLVDDDPHFLISLNRGLSLEGFAVRAVESTGAGVEVLDTRWPDILLLDVAMPGMDGINFCRLIRDRYALPILMLTARDGIEDRISGLNAGADDYLGKPFDLNELVARIRALLRRTAPRHTSNLLTFEDIALDQERWTVLAGGAALELTAREFQLLAQLISEPGKVFSREELLQAAWQGDADVYSNVVDVHITNLRRKLEANGRPRLIATVRGAGYALRRE